MTKHTDVDMSICKCAQFPIEFPDGHWLDRVGEIYQVELGFEEPVWICINCLIGLEEW
jgi:hypothetical protein